jgi:serine/threonine protein kinase
VADLAPETALGDRFTVVGVLGRGGMATVYLVNDLLRGEPVALKVLHPHLTASASARARLRREVASAGRLRHPRALVPWDLHELDGRLALSMPLHPGHTLAEHVARSGPLTATALERLARQLADALVAAHGIGLVHRDVTPRNVLIDDDGDAVLSDFGLARFVDAATATGTGALGTVGYAAPEAWRGTRADPRADLYGLGAVLHFAATGAAPFGTGDPVAVIGRQLAGERRPLAEARPDLPAHLAVVIDRMLALEPEDRPAGAAAVLTALDTRRVAEPPPRPEAAGPGIAPAHHLPPGDFTVVVKEKNEDQGRRASERQHRRTPRSRLEQDLTRAVETVSKTVITDWLGLLPSRTPEERLVDAVCRAAGLPPGSLVAPSNLWERRFRLVERTDEATATQLAQAANDAGFTAFPALADPGPVVVAPRPRVSVAARIVGVVAAIALIGGFLSAMSGVGSSTGGSFGVLGIAGLVAAVWFITKNSRSTPKTPEHGPVAFGRDLRFHLAPDAPVTLPPLPVGEAPPRPAAPSPAPAAPVAPPPTHPNAALLARTREQIRALRAAIDANDTLPDLALADLRATADALAGHVDALGDRAEALDAELRAHDPAAMADAVDRVEARLSRLETLRAAGQGAHDDEIARLQASLGAHREQLAQAEETEGRLTLVVARLLEIGATAARVRGELRGEVEQPTTADDLTRRLGAQASAASDAVRAVRAAHAARGRVSG